MIKVMNYLRINKAFIRTQKEITDFNSQNYTTHFVLSLSENMIVMRTKIVYVLKTTRLAINSDICKEEI